MRCWIVIFFLIPSLAGAQDLTAGSEVTDRLKNGASIRLYSTRDCASCYYYLPTNLAISRKTDGIPEISLMTWKDNEDTKLIGGILHFLVSWGIGPEDDKYICSRLRSKVDSMAVIVGPASVQSTPEGPQFVGDDDLAGLLIAHLTTTPQAPVLPGSKMAFSFRFDENGIDRLMKYVDNPSKAVTKLALVYTYTLVQSNGMVQSEQVRIELPMADIFKHID